MRNFFHKLLAEPAEKEKAALLYGRIMASARDLAFFTRYGLPDEFETRFELLVLHVFLVLNRLEGHGPAAWALAQALVEMLVADLDRTLREMGVGDVGVAKRMKHFMEAFYGRARAYHAALGSNDEKELLRVLDRNLYAAIATDLVKLKDMRAYILGRQSQLKKIALDDFLEGADIFLPA